MKLFSMFVLAFALTACSGIQLEGVSYTLPNGQAASCVPHPDKPDWMECSYNDGVNEITIGVEKNRISRR